MPDFSYHHMGENLMLQSTHIPDVYTLRLSDWDLSQPAEKGGYGSRTVIICRVSLLGTQVSIQYLRHEAYSREAPSVPWRHVQTYVAPLNTGLEAVIRGHFLTEVIAALSPVAVVAGHTDQDTDADGATTTDGGGGVGGVGGGNHGP